MKILTGDEAINYSNQVSTEDTLHFTDYTGKPIVIVNPSPSYFWQVLQAQRDVTLGRHHTASGERYPKTFKNGRFSTSGIVKPIGVEQEAEQIYTKYGKKWDIT